MPRNPLLEAVKTGKPSLGLFAETPQMIELSAYLGVDWIAIDQMFTSNDWSRAEDLIRASQASDVTPVLRIQSDPWLGRDRRLAVDVSRAQGIGAQFILVSNSGIEEIQECAEVAKDWHKKLFTIHPFENMDEWNELRDAPEQRTYIIPQPESAGALEALEACFQIPGISMCFIAMTDASRVLTDSNQPDWYSPQLWEYVDHAVALGKQHGITVGANTSYAYELPELAKRVDRLLERGVTMILLQNAMFLFQIAVGPLIRQIKSQMA